MTFCDLLTFRSTSERRNSSDTERDITTLAESTINDLLDRIKCTTESTTLLNDGETMDTSVTETRDTTCDSVTLTRDTTDSEKTSQCVTERDLTSVTRDSKMMTNGDKNGDKAVTISEGTSTDRPPRLDQDTLSRIDTVTGRKESEGENLVRSISKTDCQIFNELEKMGKCLRFQNTDEIRIHHAVNYCESLYTI